MSKRLFTILTLIIMLAIGTLCAWADHGDKGNKHNEHNGNQYVPNDDQGWQRQDGYEYRMYGDDERPAGWSHGKKTGWGNCGLPPGQAKKYGCRMYVYQGRPYYYYQEDDGRMIVRRPAIEVHGSVDIVY
jgi:hypothetical protein